MEEFTEEHAKRLLDKEWMVKVDSSKATPYLMKYHFSLADISCCILVTDTKSVWTEVINSKLLARRWRSCNPTSPEPFARTGDEDAWRERTLELLSKAHTIGGLAELSFEIVDSKYSDLAFELECEAFKWKWETCYLGHQRSSDIISQHLIFPLISLNHLAFSSAEAVGELSDGDLEKTVDKLGRTARRTVDNHIKNALSKPRVATSIRRMTAMFNFIPELPPIASIAEKPLFEVEEVEVALPKSSKVTSERKRDSSPSPATERIAQNWERSAEAKPAPSVQPDSATESEADEPMETTSIPNRQNSPGPSGVTLKATTDNSSTVQAPPASTKAKIAKQSSDSESSPPRPVKKARPAAPPSSDDDSEQDNKKSRSGSAAATGAVKRGTRQPIKRGGKRF